MEIQIQQRCNHSTNNVKLTPVENGNAREEALESPSAWLQRWLPEHWGALSRTKQEDQVQQWKERLPAMEQQYQNECATLLGQLASSIRKSERTTDWRLTAVIASALLGSIATMMLSDHLSVLFTMGLVGFASSGASVVLATLMRSGSAGQKIQSVHYAIECKVNLKYGSKELQERWTVLKEFGIQLSESKKAYKKLQGERFLTQEQYETALMKVLTNAKPEQEKAFWELVKQKRAHDFESHAEKDIHQWYEIACRRVVQQELDRVRLDSENRRCSCSV